MATKSKPDFLPVTDTGVDSGFGAPMEEEQFGAPMEAEDQDFNVDLSRFDNTPSWYAKEGVYRAELTDVRKAVSQAGNNMIEWDFTIRSASKYAGRTLTNRTALTPRAMFRVVSTLETLGIGGAGQNVRFTKSQVVGQEVGIVVVDDGFDNKGRVACRIDKVASLAELAEAIEEHEAAEALEEEQAALAADR